MGGKCPRHRSVFMLTSNAATGPLTEIAQRYRDSPDEMRSASTAALRAAGIGHASWRRPSGWRAQRRFVTGLRPGGRLSNAGFPATCKQQMSRRLSRGFRFSGVWLAEKLPPVYDVGRGSTLPPSWN